MWVAIAFTTGLVGSLHCLGMCGPLFVAMMGKSHKHGTNGQLAYHLGRISTYVALGALLGILGKGVSFLGWQKSLSIAMGIGIILLQFFPHKLHVKALNASALLKKSWNIYQRPSTLGTRFLMGVANGLLPCGLLYLALASSLTLPFPLESMGFMLFFGIGTLPAWAICSWGITRFPGVQVKYLLSGFSVLVGIFLILRGMELGIPLLSPEFPLASSTGIPICK